MARWVLTPAGEAIIRNGSPEFNFMQLIPSTYPGISPPVLKARLGVEEYEECFDICMTNGWLIVIPIDGMFRAPRVNFDVDHVREMLRKPINELDRTELSVLRRRNLIKLQMIA